MSLARAAILLLTRQNHGLKGIVCRLGAVAGLQQAEKQLGSGAQQPGAAGWLQWRGFAAPGGSGSSSGSSPDELPKQPNEQQEQPTAADGKAAAEQPEQEAKGPGDAPPAVSQQQQDPPPAAEGKAAAGTASTPSEGPEQPLEHPSFYEQHPQLQKYIDNLKMLKGSSTVQRQTVGGDVAWWQTLIAGWLGPIIQGWISDFVKTKVEQEFDPKDFLEGAKDAYYTVHELLRDEDWDALRPMMSAKLHAAFKDTTQTYRDNGLVWRTELSGDPQVGLRGMGFMTRDMMQQYDAEQAALAPDDISPLARPTGAWLVLTVQLKCEQSVTITREEDGQVVAELKDLRPARWKFATGPLPAGCPVDRLETPWFLLSV